MGDIMIDLETWGLIPGCAIRSIGAVAFEIGLESQEITGKTFYCNVDDKSCLLWGLQIEPETQRWWEAQSAEAKAAFSDSEPQELAHALQSFVFWVSQNSNSSTRIWSHGAGFDLPILHVAGSKTGVKMPWGYRNERDTRTLFMMANQADPDYFRQIMSFKTGVHHHSLDDAVTQSVQVSRAYASIK
jgi:hypothetical protein